MIEIELSKGIVNSQNCLENSNIFVKFQNTLTKFGLSLFFVKINFLVNPLININKKMEKKICFQKSITIFLHVNL